MHATTGESEGEEAFYQCARFKGGSFFNLEWTEPECITIHKSGERLIIEAARLRDEEEGAE